MTREEVAGFMRYLQEEERRKVDGIVPSTNEIAFGIAIEALSRPPVVYCKECTYYGRDTCGSGCCANLQPPLDRIVFVEPEWFCAYGRKQI